MLARDVFYFGLKKLISKTRVISISGPSSTGKTTLAQYLIGNLLTNIEPYENCCIWIQASEAFPKKRLLKMFEAHPKKLAYLERNIYIAPKSKPCSSYSEQFTTLNKLSKEDFVYLSDLKFIVIDNISHHLRYEISKLDNDINSIVSMKNYFFNQILEPLIFFCEREDVNLVLIHEVSYNVKEGTELPYYHVLYDRIDCLDITLKKNIFTKEKTMKIKFGEIDWTFSYNIVDKGITFKR